MNQAEIQQLLPSWQAELSLSYQQRGERTVLASRSQRGPLTVQKSLYPEGEGVCHTILLHPPGGIAGGDELAIRAHLSAAPQNPGLLTLIAPRHPARGEEIASLAAAPEKLAEMAAAARGQGVLDGAERLADLVMRVVAKSGEKQANAEPAATA